MCFPPWGYQFWAIINNASVNKYLLDIGFHFSWSRFLGVELFVSFCLIFKRLQNCFSKMAIYITLSSAIYEGSSFSTFLPTFGIVFWIIAILVVFQCDINLHITMIVHLWCKVIVCLKMDSFYKKAWDNLKSSI